MYSDSRTRAVRLGLPHHDREGTAKSTSTTAVMPVARTIIRARSVMADPRTSGPLPARCAGSAVPPPTRRACAETTTRGRSNSLRVSVKGCPSSTTSRDSGSMMSPENRSTGLVFHRPVATAPRKVPHVRAAGPSAPPGRRAGPGSATGLVVVAGAPEHRADAGEQLSRRVRLDHVVVGTGTEPSERIIASTSDPSRSGRPRSRITASGSKSPRRPSASARRATASTAMPCPDRSGHGKALDGCRRPRRAGCGARAEGIPPPVRRAVELSRSSHRRDATVEP